MPFPTIRACILCEEMREERRGLISLLGFYGLTPDVDVLVQNFAAPGVMRVTFVFVGSGGEGHFTMSLRLFKPDGVVLFESPGPGLPLDVVPPRRANIGFNLVPGLRLPEPGTYRIELLADGEPVFQTTFAVRQASPGDFA